MKRPFKQRISHSALESEELASRVGEKGARPEQLPFPQWSAVVLPRDCVWGEELRLESTCVNHSTKQRVFTLLFSCRAGNGDPENGNSALGEAQGTRGQG